MQAILHPTPENPLPPGAECVELVTRDKQHLRVMKVIPETARGTFVILGGRGDFIERYFETVRDLSRADVVVSLDADLQNDPEDIPMLLAKLDEGYDVVSGWRKDRKDTFINRRLPVPAFQRTTEGDWLKQTDLAVTFLDRYGNEVGSRGIKHNDSTPLDEFPDHLIKATLATEESSRRRIMGRRPWLRAECDSAACWPTQ